MTTDDDIALKDLVAQTLDARGILPKMRAELRANVFHALEETEDLKKLQNDELAGLVHSENGQLAINLVREFLSHCNLDFTLSVFNPESRIGVEYSEMKRGDMAKNLNLSASDPGPLLCQILERFRGFSAGEVKSPGGLNSTYTKEIEPIKDEEEEEQPYSVATESVSEASLKEEEEESEETASKSGRMTPNDQQNESINLLMFTPVQEVRTVPKDKTEKQEEKRVSSLKDLPPLQSVSAVGNKKHIAEIRKQLEEGLADDSNKSDGSKSGSDETIQDDDDINGILNSNESSESKQTVDETVSKISGLDHVESV